MKIKNQRGLPIHVTSCEEEYNMLITKWVGDNEEFAMDLLDYEEFIQKEYREIFFDILIEEFGFDEGMIVCLNKFIELSMKKKVLRDKIKRSDEK